MKNSLIFLFLLLCSDLISQQFGKNKVQYKDIEWRFIQTSHFDIYFYKGGETIAEFTADVAESAYVEIKANWNFEINRRVPILIYSSHNDFQQSLVVESYLDEGIGGVTELFKNRIIVPYEGSYQQFRHVIHHELVHAVMNDMLYGGTVQSLISRRVTQAPLWFAEGLAEWESVGWDKKMDMYIRDAVINNTMPPIQYLNFYLAYQGGANLFKYISIRFGREKVQEILKKVQGAFNFYAAFESAIGMKIEKLSEDWHEYLKKEYWPEILDREKAEVFAERITDHVREQSFFNSSPTISPKGDKMAYLSNKDGYFSIYIKNIITGKDIERIVRGNTSNDFEELHFLSPGMSWSPDENYIAFSAKGGSQDYLYLVNTKNGDITEYDFDGYFDGVFDAAFSPDGEKIAFIGNKNGASDVYVYEFNSKKLSNVTNDVFTDIDPAWSPDGKKIAFASDRRSNLNTRLNPYQFKMQKYDYEQNDIYIIDLESNIVERVTDTEADERSPAFSPDGHFLAFASDLSGISNIYFKNIEKNEEAYPVSNLLTGAYQLSWSKDGKQMLFTNFSKGGWDIYNLKNPLDLKEVEIEDTRFVKNKNARHFSSLDNGFDFKSNNDNFKSDNTYSNFNFAKLRFQNSNKEKEPEDDNTVKLTDYKKDGKYKVRDYEPDWSLDFVTANAIYNNFYGVRGFYTLLMSDVSGAHRILMNTNFVLNFRNTDLYLMYSYLPKQINYHFAGFHLANNFASGASIYTYRNYGISSTLSRPFNKFKRLDLTTSWMAFELSDNTFNQSSSNRTLLTTLSYIHDNTQWFYTGPIDGSRFNLSATLAPKIADNVSFVTLKFDSRNYFRFWKRFALATRITAGTSYGLRTNSNGRRVGQQKFRMGGVDFWLFNTKYRNDTNSDTNRDPFVENVDDVSFTEFVTPLRGAFYNEKSGRNYALMNLELRFPFIDYLIMQVPPLPLQQIRGTFFFDIGSAFDHFRTFRGFKNGKTEDLVIGYGVGIQAYVPFFGGLFRFDTAWQDFGDRTSEPRYYFSFGYDL